MARNHNCDTLKQFWMLVSIGSHGKLKFTDRQSHPGGGSHELARIDGLSPFTAACSKSVRDRCESLLGFETSWSGRECCNSNLGFASVTIASFSPLPLGGLTLPNLLDPLSSRGNKDRRTISPEFGVIQLFRTCSNHSSTQETRPAVEPDM